MKDFKFSTIEDLEGAKWCKVKESKKKGELEGVGAMFVKKSNQNHQQHQQEGKGFRGTEERGVEVLKKNEELED